MESESYIDTHKSIRSKDVIAQMAADIEAKHQETIVENEGMGKFWEKLSLEQQEELRSFILNPPQNTPTSSVLPETQAESIKPSNSNTSQPPDILPDMGSEPIPEAILQ